MSLRLAALAAAVLLLPAVAHAADPFDGPPFSANADDVIKASRLIAVSEGAHVTDLRFDETMTFDEAGAVVVRFHRFARVETPIGVEFIQTEQLPFRPWREGRPEVRARVMTVDGRVRELDPATLVETAYPTDTTRLFDERRLLQAPLPGIAVGAILEDEIVYRTRPPTFDGGTASRRDFAAVGVATERSRFVIDEPAAATRRHIEVHGAGVKSKTVVADGRRRTTVVAGHVDALALPEESAPRRNDDGPRVEWTTGTTWQHVAERYGALVDSAIGRSDVAASAREAKGDATDGKTIAARLLARLHRDVRYTGVELGDADYTPRAPDETLKRGFGDCKDQAVLLVALLRAAGVAAHVVLLDADPRELPPTLPGIGGFNHAIVHVDADAQNPSGLWVDATNEFARVGELPPGDAGRMALIVADTTRDATRTPPATARPDAANSRNEVLLSDEEGPARVNVTVETHGEIEDVMRYHAALDGVAFDRDVGANAVHRFGGQAVAPSHSDPRQLDGPMTLKVTIDSATVGVTHSDRALVRLEEAAIAVDLPDALEAREPSVASAVEHRRQDLALRAPLSLERVYVIRPPHGFVLPEAGLPADDSATLGTIRFTRQARRLADDAVEVTLRLTTGDGLRFTADELRAARAAVLRFEERPALELTFARTAETLRAAGRLEDSVAETRRLVEKYPDEAVHHVQHGRALLVVGLNDAGTIEMRRAVALAPRSVFAHRYLTLALSGDTLSRDQHPGFDRVAALAEARVAVALAPDDADAHLDLRGLLAVDANGNPNFSNDRAEALEEDRRIETLTGAPRVETLWDLFHLGRYGELVKAARPMPLEPARDSLLVGGVALTEGVDAAVTTARALVPEDKRSITLSNAGDRVKDARRYDLAQKLYEAALEGSSNTQALTDMAQRMTTLRVQTAKAGDDPESVVRSVMIVLLDETLDEAGRDRALAPLLTPELLSDERATHALRKSLCRRVEGAYPQVKRSVTVADALLSIATFRVDGARSAGYRVSVASEPTLTFLLSARDGHPRVVAFLPMPAPVGLEVLRLVDEGRLVAATLLLRWTRDEDTSQPPLTVDEATARAARLLRGDWRKRALPQLERCFARAGFEESRLACAESLVAAALERKSIPDATRLLDRAEHDMHKEMPATRYSLLRTAGRFTDARALAERMARTAPQQWSTSLRDALMHEGNFDAATAAARSITANSTRSTDWNQLAWTLVAAGHVDADTIAAAERAVELSHRKDHSALDTLAVAYALAGRIPDAMRAMVDELDTSDERATAIDFPLGVVAEHFGERDAALAYYRRFKNTDSGSDSDYSLAQLRIAKLLAAGAPARPGSPAPPPAK